MSSLLFKDLYRILRGTIAYWLRGITPDSGYQGLVDLFCLSRGRSNDFFHTLVALFVGKYPVRRFSTSGAGILPLSALRDSTRDLRRDGYYIFSQKLSPAQGAALTEIAHRVPCVPVSDGNISREPVIYDPKAPVASVCKFREADLVLEPAVQRLMADASFIALAQHYLNCAPVLSSVALWWTSASDRASLEGAQWYHFDMDRIKWLKLFFYVTDVTLENGPHVFIQGTHKSGSQPKELLRRGYTRLPDSDVEKYYSPDRVKVIMGSAGTLFAEDTRGFHKGLMAKKGHRLVFELEFCDSLFGGQYLRAPVPSPVSELRQAWTLFPRTYRKYQPSA